MDKTGHSAPETAAEVTAKVTAWCDATAQLLGLPLDKADRGEVIANLRVLKQQMDLVGGFPFDDREEPAPQFRA